MMRWVAFEGTLLSAHNACCDRLLSEGGSALMNTPFAAAAVDNAVTGVWLLEPSEAFLKILEPSRDF